LWILQNSKYYALNQRGKPHYSFVLDFNAGKVVPGPKSVRP